MSRDFEHVLVTGAAGFVGSVMCTRLSELGYNVIAVDNLCRGLNYPVVSKLPNVRFVLRDLLEQDIADLLTENYVTAVMHYAAATGDLTRPDSELNEINLGITQRIAENIHQHAGENCTLTFPTTSLALKIPDSGYVKSKELAIKYLADDSPLAKEQLLLYRFFNNAGGYGYVGELRQKEVHMLPRLFRALLQKEKFVINGDNYDTVDGTPARDYVHVQDSVDFMIHRMNRAALGHYFVDDNGLLCEIGRGEPWTVNEILDQLWQVRDRLIIPNFEERYFSLMRNIVIGPRRDFDCGTLQCTAGVNFHQFRDPLHGFDTILVDSLNSYYQYHCRSRQQYIDQIIPNPNGK